MLPSSSIFLTNELLFIVTALPKTCAGMHSITSPVLIESSIFEESVKYTVFLLLSIPIATVFPPSFLFIVATRTITGSDSFPPSISISVASFP